jgi:riboflavin kinase/FMN adenylyltransferase
MESKNRVVTIGTFDGVHIGHQKILKRLVKISKEKDLLPTVLTFFPHPRMVLQKDTSIKLINTIDEKTQLMSAFGIENLVVKEFTKEFSRLTALEFVRDILVNELQIKHIIVGYDHRFGRNRTASIEDLKSFGETFDFTVEEISAQDINDVTVSSTKIRKALLEGELKIANAYLGYNFMLIGKVVSGKGIGKTINYPTANIKISKDYKLIPKKGVYLVKTSYQGKVLFGMMNIGTNPTLNGTEETIEVHIFNFNEDIYGQSLKIELLDRLRDQQKFESLDQLKGQLAKDAEASKKYITQHFE